MTGFYNHLFKTASINGSVNGQASPLLISKHLPKDSSINNNTFNLYCNHIDKTVHHPDPASPGCFLQFCPTASADLMTTLSEDRGFKKTGKEEHIH